VLVQNIRVGAVDTARIVKVEGGLKA